MNKLVYKGFLYESITDGEVKIIKAGTTLFHGTGESINGKLVGGGYDEVLWTTNSSTVAQMYISHSDKVQTKSSEGLSSPPMYGKNDGVITNILGIRYDVKYDNGILKTYQTLAPPEFVEIENKYKELSKKWYEEYSIVTSKEKEYIELSKNENLDDEAIDKLEEEIDKLNRKFAITKKEYTNFNIKTISNRYVNDKLKSLGYEPDSSVGPNESYLWNINVDNNDNILPPDYKTKGKLYIIIPQRDMKMYDISTGEGDINDVQYNSLDLFRELEEQGYDGIIIDDFAQHNKMGNFGHKSFGFFKTAYDSLDSEKYIDGVTHPEDVFKKHSPEYIKATSNNTPS